MIIVDDDGHHHHHDNNYKKMNMDREGVTAEDYSIN